MEALLLHAVMPGTKASQAAKTLARAPPAPAGETHVLFESFWLERGPLALPAGGKEDDGGSRRFVLTPSVRTHLANLARAALVRRHPILLQVRRFGRAALHVVSLHACMRVAVICMGPARKSQLTAEPQPNQNLLKTAPGPHLQRQDQPGVLPGCPDGPPVCAHQQPPTHRPAGGPARMTHGAAVACCGGSKISLALPLCKVSFELRVWRTHVPTTTTSCTLLKPTHPPTHPPTTRRST